MILYKKASKTSNFSPLASQNISIGRDPFNQNFRKFRSKTEWIASVQPEIFEKLRPRHLSRWTTFHGLTSPIEMDRSIWPSQTILNGFYENVTKTLENENLRPGLSFRSTKTRTL